MAKKKKSKFKKILKTLGKVAALGGAAYGASKLFGGRRGSVSTAGQPVGVSRAAHKPAHLGLQSYTKSPLPEHLTPDMGASAYSPDKPWYKFWKEGGRVNAKKGGRVTGAAKRGFGRALMKGKK
jgi:hypothetical protein